MQLQPGLVDPSTGRPYGPYSGPELGPYGGFGQFLGPYGMKGTAGPQQGVVLTVIAGTLVAVGLAAITYGFYKGLQGVLNLLLSTEPKGPLLPPPDPLPQWPEPRIDYEHQYMMLDALPVMYAGLEVDIYGSPGRSRSTMTDEEIQAAAHAAFHLGAGWGGFSTFGPPDSTSGRTIDSQGNIYNGDPGKAVGQSQFPNGLPWGGGRTTTPDQTPTPPPDQPQGPEPGEIET